MRNRINTPHGISIASGGFSSSPYLGPYQYKLPIYTNKLPISIRIEVSGCVGVGITHIEIEKLTERFIPRDFSVINGNVEHPENLLEEGMDWCFLGDGRQDLRRKFNNLQLKKDSNVIEVQLKNTKF